MVATSTPTYHGLYRQIVAGSAASLCAFASATTTGWLAPLLPRLLGPDSEIPMTSEEASWMVTMPEFGNLLSPIPAGYLADRFGRKTVILASGPVFLIGWIILLYFKTLLALNIARIIHGIGVGIAYAVVPMYLGEIANPKFRGAITSTFFFFWGFGFLFEYIIGPKLSLTNFTYATAFTNIVFIIAFMWQPESPYYYLMKNDLDKAEQSLAWFFSTTQEEISEELLRMKLSVDEDMKKKVSLKDLVTDRSNRRGMTILLLIGFIRIFCGLLSLSSFSTETLTDAGDDFFLSPDDVTILMGVMMFIGSFSTLFTLDIFGRTTLLFFSCVFSGLIMFFIGTFYFLKQNTSINVSPFGWIPSVGIIVYSATAVLGIFPVSTVYPSELFDSSTRATASGVMTVFTTVTGVFLFVSYLPISNLFGVFLNFYIFAFVCFFGAVLSRTLMPETKGKTFEQIKDLLHYGK